MSHSNTFAALGLSPELQNLLAGEGLRQPSAIQARTIPAILAGQDVLGIAPTGSGKTLAFALPLLQQVAATARDTRYQQGRRCFALILAPTRELAVQSAACLNRFSSKAQRIKTVALFGGVSLNPQMMALLGGADIVVATPGRLLDLLDHNALDISQISCLVLDEADRLLDAGFAEELSRILAQLPARRQNLLFSATLPPDVQALAETLLHEPLRINIETEAPRILQRAIHVDASRRTALLLHLLQTGQWTRVLVFVATQYACETVAAKLLRRGIHAAPLHGQLSQGARSEVLAEFKGGRLHVLIATDLAARGLDIARLPVVINYDLPRAASDYTHRIGRCGRAGEEGLAISFIPADAEAHFRLIEKRQGFKLARESLAGFEAQQTAAPGSADGGIKGKRKSKKDKLREAAAAAAKNS